MTVLAHAAAARGAIWTAGLIGLAFAVHLARQDPSRRPPAIMLGAGVVVALLAVAPAVDHAAERTFAGHMAQHLVLVLLAAPLVAAGAARLTGWRPHPAVAFVAVALTLWAWHVPALWDLAARAPVWHAVEHATMLGSATALWASAGRWTEPSVAAFGVLFATALHSGALGALITFAPDPQYGHALADQQLGGLLMWVPGGLVYAAAALSRLLFGVLVVREAAP